MSRKRKFISGLISSYALIGLTVLYTIASIPLSLHYLEKQEFGIWALITQISGYLILIEFGISGSVARFLADYKDDINGGTYGSILKTGHRIFLAQGLILIVTGTGLCVIAPSILKIPENLSIQFFWLMLGQTVLSGVGLSLRGYGSPLWSHQRLDISNLASAFTLAVNFGTLWWGYQMGWKLYSLTFASAMSQLISFAITYGSCRHLKLYPHKNTAGKFDRVLFRELFGFGGGIFLMNLGSQMLSASQTIIITRALGIESAATWSICTKVSTMAQQFIGRILDSSAGGLAEMIVRNEQESMLKRFRDVVSLTGVLALATAIGISLLNGPFISIWTSGKIHWDHINNLLLGILAFTTGITRCHAGLSGLTKHIGGMKFVYLVEGFLFVIMAYGLSKYFGFAGILVASIVCNLAVTGRYVISRTAQYFKRPSREVFSWTWRGITVFAPVLLAFFAMERFSPHPEVPISPLHFVLLSLGVAVVFGPILWFYALARPLRKEMTRVAVGMICKISIKS